MSKIFRPVAKLILQSTDVKLLQTYIENYRKLTIKNNSRYSGPVSFKTKVYKLHIRRAPSGEGSGTYFFFTKKIWKKAIKIYNEKMIQYILKSQAEISENMKLELELL